MKTVNTSLNDFPLYFSLLSHPGYDLRKLKSYGFDSEAGFFLGRIDNENYTKTLNWGYRNTSIQSIIDINIRFFNRFFSGIYNESKGSRMK